MLIYFSQFLILDFWNKFKFQQMGNLLKSHLTNILILSGCLYFVVCCLQAISYKKSRFSELVMLSWYLENFLFHIIRKVRTISHTPIVNFNLSGNETVNQLIREKNPFLIFLTREHLAFMLLVFSFCSTPSSFPSAGFVSSH